MSIWKIKQMFSLGFREDNIIEENRAPKYNYESEEKMRSEATKFSTRTGAKPK